jgi:hypothetical protein
VTDDEEEFRRRTDCYCPFCGVEAGEACVTKRGGPARATHRKRQGMRLLSAIYARWPDRYPRPFWFKE